MTERVVLRGGTVVRPDGSARLDVAIADGRVVEVAPTIDGDGADVLDCSGCAIGPGLVDLHAHLREPGMEEAETVESAARAAALGGFTAVVAMPNTEPACDDVSVVHEVRARARRAVCDVAVAGAITAGRRGEALAPMGELASAGVTLFTDDGACVADGEVMRRALEYAKGLSVTLAQHCEAPDLANGGVVHEGELSSLLGLRGQPELAETAVVFRDLGLVELTGAAMHFLHLSTPGAVLLVDDAKRRGLPVSCEVAPHHLTLTDEATSGYDPRFEVQPPLRPRATRDALVACLREGRIDAVATDHAPHPDERKLVPFDEAAPGMLGLQHAVGLTAAALGGADCDLVRLFTLLSFRPAQIARLCDTDPRLGGESPQGQVVEPGAAANLCVVDLETPLVVSVDQLASRSRNSPYLGMTLPVSVRHTLHRGEPVVVGQVVLR